MKAELVAKIALANQVIKIYHSDYGPDRKRREYDAAVQRYVEQEKYFEEGDPFG